MCVNWYFTKYFLELSYHFFSKSKGRILDEWHVSFKHKIDFENDYRNKWKKNL